MYEQIQGRFSIDDDPYLQDSCVHVSHVGRGERGY